MIRRKILYILILTVGIWLSMLYTFQGLRFLMGILLILPFVCLFLLFAKAPCCRVEAGEIPACVTRGACVRFSIKAVYRGFLPLAGLCIGMRWDTYGAGTVRYRKRLWGIGSRCEKEIELEFAAEHCGQAEFSVAKAGIYDCLGLFSVPVKRSGKVGLLVMPVITPLPEDEAALITGFLRMRRSGAEDGDYFVRDYRPGDSPRSIHWKLTAKEDELQVKDFQPDNTVRLLLNMTDALLAEPEKRDAFLDKACSLMAFLAETATDGFEVSWMQEGVLRCSRIEAKEALYPCIRELLEVKRAGGMLPEGDLHREMQECRLEADGRLYLGEQYAYEE